MTTTGMNAKDKDSNLTVELEHVKNQIKWIEDQLCGRKPQLNLTESTKTYPEKSTCHGLSYIFDSTSTAPRRMIWLFLYLACASSYLYFAISAVIEYLEFPVTSSIEYKYVSMFHYFV